MLNYGSFLAVQSSTVDELEFQFHISFRLFHLGKKSLDQSFFHPFFSRSITDDKILSLNTVISILRNLSIIYWWLWFANDADWSMTHRLSSSDWSILIQFLRDWLMKQFLRNQLICCNKRLIKDKTVTGPFLEYKPSFRPSFQPFS